MFSSEVLDHAVLSAGLELLVAFEKSPLCELSSLWWSVVKTWTRTASPYHCQFKSFYNLKPFAKSKKTPVMTRSPTVVTQSLKKRLYNKFQELVFSTKGSETFDSRKGSQLDWQNLNILCCWWHVQGAAGTFNSNLKNYRNKCPNEPSSWLFLSLCTCGLWSPVKGFCPIWTLTLYLYSFWSLVASAPGLSRPQTSQQGWVKIYECEFPNERANT